MHAKAILICLSALAPQLLTALPTTDPLSPHDLEIRQTGATSGLSKTCPYTKRLGQPKGKTFHNVQVTDRLDCKDNSNCATAKINQHTFGIEASIGIDVAIEKIASGLTGGLAISEEWTSGTQYECGGEKGDVVCVFAKAEYSIMDVQVPEDGKLCSNRLQKMEAKIPVKDGGDGGLFCEKDKTKCGRINSDNWSDN